MEPLLHVDSSLMLAELEESLESYLLNIWRYSEWFKSNVTGCLTSWNQEKSKCVFSSVNSCFNGWKGKFFFFSHHIMTGDENWIHYNSPKCRKSSDKSGYAAMLLAKPCISMVLSFCFVFGRISDVTYYKLLKLNENITGNCYQLQLMCLSWALQEKWPLC